MKRVFGVALFLAVRLGADGARQYHSKTEGWRA